jgi:hypothetical protein
LQPRGASDSRDGVRSDAEWEIRIWSIGRTSALASRFVRFQL